MKLKKQLYIIAIFITVLGLSACGSRSKVSQKKTDNVENENKEKEEIKVTVPAAELELTYKAEDISIFSWGRNIY